MKDVNKDVENYGIIILKLILKGTVMRTFLNRLKTELNC